MDEATFKLELEKGLEVISTVEKRHAVLTSMPSLQACACQPDAGVQNAPREGSSWGTHMKGLSSKDAVGNPTVIRSSGMEMT